MPQKWERWRNRKNGQNYIIIKLATEDTNERSGKKTVVYEDRNGDWYVRDLNEFLQKFERAN